MLKLMKVQGFAQAHIVTEKLRSYAAVFREIS